MTAGTNGTNTVLCPGGAPAGWGSTSGHPQRDGNRDNLTRASAQMLRGEAPVGTRDRAAYLPFAKSVYNSAAEEPMQESSFSLFYVEAPEDTLGLKPRDGSGGIGMLEVAEACLASAKARLRKGRAQRSETTSRPGDTRSCKPATSSFSLPTAPGSMV